MASTLHSYLKLEAVMIASDEMGAHDDADAIRDVMDGMWRGLSNQEREFLNSRDDFVIAPVRPTEAQPPASFDGLWQAA